MRAQARGNAGGVIKGIGVVTCVYLSPHTEQFWRVDFRLYDPEGNGPSKLDHGRQRLTNGVHPQQLPFEAGLMDTWYATKPRMRYIEARNTVSSCPLKANRQVDEAGGQQPYQRVDALPG